MSFLAIRTAEQDLLGRYPFLSSSMRPGRLPEIRAVGSLGTPRQKDGQVIEGIASAIRRDAEGSLMQEELLCYQTHVMQLEKQQNGNDFERREVVVPTSTPFLLWVWLSALGPNSLPPTIWVTFLQHRQVVCRYNRGLKSMD